MEKAGMDEKYCMWYICPECGDDNIAASYNYCPNCGKELSEGAKNTEPEEIQE